MFTFIHIFGLHFLAKICSAVFWMRMDLNLSFRCSIRVNAFSVWCNHHKFCVLTSVHYPWVRIWFLLPAIFTCKGVLQSLFFFFRLFYRYTVLKSFSKRPLSSCLLLCVFDIRQKIILVMNLSKTLITLWVVCMISGWSSLSRWKERQSTFWSTLFEKTIIINKIEPGGGGASVCTRPQIRLKRLSQRRGKCNDWQIAQLLNLNKFHSSKTIVCQGVMLLTQLEN